MDEVVGRRTSHCTSVWENRCLKTNLNLQSGYSLHRKDNAGETPVWKIFHDGRWRNKFSTKNSNNKSPWCILKVLVGGGGGVHPHLRRRTGKWDGFLHSYPSSNWWMKPPMPATVSYITGYIIPSVMDNIRGKRNGWSTKGLHLYELNWIRLGTLLLVFTDKSYFLFGHKSTNHFILLHVDTKVPRDCLRISGKKTNEIK